MCTKKKRHVFRPGRLALMALLPWLALPVMTQAQDRAAAGYDLPAIEMVKSGVDRRAILLKINLTEMRRAEAAAQPAAAPVLSPDSSSF